MKARWIIAFMLAGLALAAWLRLLVGDPAGLHLPESPLVWELRLGRLVPGLIVGGSLAVAGVLLQALLRNPLASPDLIGASSGAGLGVMASLYVQHLMGRSVSDASVPAGSGGAIAGALGALTLVYVLGRRSRVLDPVSLVLVGAIVAIVCSAVTVLLAHLIPGQGVAVARWTIGALSDDAPRAQVAAAGALLVLALAASLVMSRALDAGTLHDDEARSVGVNLGLVRASSFALAGLLTAGAVAVAGPIGFVGLVCPHLARLVLGPGHARVLVASCVLGAIMIVGADTVADLLPLPSGRLPIGVLTALVGGPAFIALLIRERRKSI